MMRGMGILAALLMLSAVSARADEMVPESGEAEVAVAVEVDAAEAREAEQLDTAARALFEAGRTAYGEGRYEDALERFQRAYEVSQRPALLYNIGQSYDRLRRDQEAIEAFERFLESSTNEELRVVVERRLVILRQNVEPEPEVVVPTPEEAADAQPHAPEPFSPPPERRIGPLIGAVAGAVVFLAIMTAVLVVFARDDDPNYVDGTVGDIYFTLENGR